VSNRNSVSICQYVRRENVALGKLGQVLGGMDFQSETVLPKVAAPLQLESKRQSRSLERDDDVIILDFGFCCFEQATRLPSHSHDNVLLVPLHEVRS